MDKIKSFLGGILAALLAAIYFFAQRDEKQLPKDPFEAEQAEIEKELAEVEKNGVEAEELTPDQVEDYWGKK